MHRFFRFLASSIVVLASGISSFSLHGAEPPLKNAQPSIPDPSAMFDRFFGVDQEEDEKLLAKIEVSEKEEAELGKTAMRSYLEYLKEQKIQVVSRGKEVDYIKRLVETVRPSMIHGDRYRKITVYIAESSRPDARSLPGGTLVFYRGLLDGVESEAALVSVIGHELSHLDHNHLLFNVKRMKLAEQTLTEKNQFSPEFFLTATGSMARLWSRPFRPEDERTADLDGARWAYEADYDPREMIRVIDKIGEEEKKRPLPIPSYFLSHPLAAERRKAVEAVYKELQQTMPKDRLYIGKENLRRRITRTEKRYPR